MGVAPEAHWGLSHGMQAINAWKTGRGVRDWAWNDEVARLKSGAIGLLGPGGDLEPDAEGPGSWAVRPAADPAGGALTPGMHGAAPGQSRVA